jgi:hypothetical protein
MGDEERVQQRRASSVRTDEEVDQTGGFMKLHELIKSLSQIQESVGPDAEVAIEGHYDDELVRNIRWTRDITLSTSDADPVGVQVVRAKVLLGSF